MKIWPKPNFEWGIDEHGRHIFHILWDQYCIIDHEYGICVYLGHILWGKFISIEQAKKAVEGSVIRAIKNTSRPIVLPDEQFVSVQEILNQGVIVE